MRNSAPTNLEHTEYVDLDRHFHEFTQTELADPELLAAYNENHAWNRSLSWNDILMRKRVVLLASAGSGKTEELAQATRKLVSENKHAFYVRLEELSGATFDSLLKDEEIERFNEWKSNVGCEGWFFLDSVDELKLTQRSLEGAFRSLNRALSQNLHRAYIIVSSRPTDWRVQADEVKFREWLPVPSAIEVAESSEDEEFLQVLGRQRFNDQRKQHAVAQDQKLQVTTVLLLPLSKRQIRTFVDHRGVGDPDVFISEIERNNAWSFASRPLDLTELATIWVSKGKLGTKQEQHTFNVDVKLKDRPDRVDAGSLSGEQATGGAEKLALAMALTRRRSIKPPDQQFASAPDESTLDSSRVLLDWPPDSVGALLRRAVFDPATLGRVRFHHQSIQEFLAARRLWKLREKGMPIRALFRLLFADRYGEKVIVPSMTPIAAWLALWDANVFRELVSRAPEVLIVHGDPGSLSLPQRQKIVGEFVRRYSSGGWRGFRFPSDQLRRIASPDLGEMIKKWWGTGPENREVRELLLDLISMGPVSFCSNIAFHTALDFKEELHLRVDAIRALAACGATLELKRVAYKILTKPNNWPTGVVTPVLPEMVQHAINEDELVNLLKRHQSRDGGEMPDGYEWALRQIVGNPPKDWDRKTFRKKLTMLIKEGSCAGESWYDVQSRYKAYCPALAELCIKELEASRGNPESDLLESCAVACHLGEREMTEEPIRAMRSWFKDQPRIREGTFWVEVEVMDSVGAAKDSWERFLNATRHSLNDSIQVTDKTWVEEALFNAQAPLKQEVAIHAWIHIWAIQGRSQRELAALRKRLKDYVTLVCILESRTKKTAESDSIKQYEEQAKRQRAKWDSEERQRLAGWDNWRRELMQYPDKYFAANKVENTIQNLFHWMERHEASSSSFCVWNFQALARFFGVPVANGAREAFKQQWRNARPQMWCERIETQRNSTPYTWIYGLCGLMAEAETPGWAKSLTPGEAGLAVRYATVEMNRFAPFLKHLAADRPAEVDDVLGGELVAELEKGGEHSHLPVLQHLSHADPTLKKLLTPRLETFLLGRQAFVSAGQENHWFYNLDQLLGILSETSNDASSKKIGLYCVKQVRNARSAALHNLWLRGVFRFDPMSAPDVLIEWFGRNKAARSDALRLHAIATLFGDWNGAGIRICDNEARAIALGKLVRIAYRTVRPKDDVEHEGAYSPDARDHAERGRSFLLSALLDTPGPVARKVITELSQEKPFRHFSDRLRHLAHERAAKDAEFEAWEVDDLVKLERRFELPPIGREAIHQLLIDRLEDLQHDLSHDEFSDRKTLQLIRDEADMQRSLALKFQAMARGAYTLDREPEVADGKKPDIRLRSTGDGTKSAIEIKIADNNWTLPQLEDALKRQLVGQYLRHESCQSGCLLITFAGRKKRWRLTEGKQLNAAQVVVHLNKAAQQIQKRSNGHIRVCVFGLWLTQRPFLENEGRRL